MGEMVISQGHEGHIPDRDWGEVGFKELQGGRGRRKAACEGKKVDLKEQKDLLVFGSLGQQKQSLQNPNSSPNQANPTLT